MLNAKVCILFLSLLTAARAFAQHGQDWLPITQQELEIKEVPGNPGAPAIQLYYANFVDDVASSEFTYHRIKILSDKGKEWADVEINAGFNTKITELKARTIKPDGSIVDFVGKPFEKIIVKGHGIKLLAKTFTLPEVSVGCIIEYKYKEDYEGGFTSDEWILQGSLFTVKESFTFKAYDGPMAGSFFEEGTRLTYVGTHITKEQQPRITKDGKADLELQNVAGFEPEEYMPPENNYKPSIHFVYVGGDIKTADAYWDHIGKRIYEVLNQFIGDHKEARQAATEVIGNETDPEKKLRKIYIRAQQVRNLSFERERTEEERKHEKLKNNEGVAEVLKRGYGDQEDITLAFVAMARAAGFDASVLLVSNREKAFFSKDVLSARALESLIADVKLNGKDVYLDPGTKYCPFGLLRWMRTSTPALRPDKKAPAFLTIPAFDYDKAVVRRTLSGAIATDGSLKSDLVVKFDGLHALEERLAAVQTDEAGRKKQLEDEVQSWLPPEAVVKLIDAQGWDVSEEPLTAHFSVDVQGYASSVGKRLLIPCYLFQVKTKVAFAHADRKYPVYFPYAFAEVDAVTLKYPSGYSIEGSPTAQDARLPYAVYQSANKLESGQLVTQRRLVFNVIYVDLPRYAEIRDFFSKVQAGDEQQAVLRVGGETSAQKGN